MRHLRSLLDLDRDELREVVDHAIRLKGERRQASHHSLLSGRVLGLYFEKPSMRTWVSFESAMAQCGGAAVFMTGKEVGLGQREPVKDFARVASQYLDILAVRVFSHELILELAEHASCPVINALSDREHPCQTLADLCTIQEQLGSYDGKRVVFVGDGNNVAISLAHAAVLTDMEFVLSAPKGFGFSEELLAECRRANPNARIEVINDPKKAVRGADVVYTDVWASMGQEAEADERRQHFQPFQVNAELMAQAKPTAIFMHCLPAHRGDECTSDVIDSDRSVIIQQAGNRLHAQKSLILWLLDQTDG